MIYLILSFLISGEENSEDGSKLRWYGIQWRAKNTIGSDCNNRSTINAILANVLRMRIETAMLWHSEGAIKKLGLR